MIKGGYFLKTARINLNKERVKVESVDEKFAIEYIGGRGWGARILYDELKTRTDGLSPNNKIVIAAGPLSGLLVPCSGKTHFTAISPQTGIYGDSNVGGYFSYSLKKSGLDGLIIEGRASRATFIVIDNDDIEFRDASPFWGMYTINTEDAIKRKIGKDFHIAAIGPAGENLVKFASVNCDYGRQAGRCGIGAVMGSKRLKAIAVRGSNQIPVADSDLLKKIYKEASAEIATNPTFKMMKKQGTLQVLKWVNDMSCLPTRNFSEVQYEQYQKIAGENMEKTTKTGNRGCYLCPMPCGQLNQAKGVTVEGPEYETAAMIGSNCALNLEETIYANYLCDQLGLDTISAGNVSAFIMECFEKGLVNSIDTDGLIMKFGSSYALFELLREIAFRQGIGNLLAEGVKKTSQKIGKGSEKFAMHVKGLEISGYDVHAAPAMALSYATADIGAHHNRSWAITYDMEKGRESYGEDKVRWVIYLQHLRPMFDALGVCRFPYVETGLDPNFYAKFYTATIGIETSLEDLLKRSERIWNLTRLINLRQGLTGEEDWLPDRVFDDPIPSGPLKGTSLDRSAFREMIDTYYRIRGWNEKGKPSENKLKELAIIHD